MPTFCPSDDVMNFMVTEALVARASQETKDQEKTQRRQQWMKDHKESAKRLGLT